MTISDEYQQHGDPLFNAECRFCTLPEPWRILRRSPNFVVQLGLGPLVEGYALILSRTHLSCFGALPVELLDEFLDVLHILGSAQRAVYGNSLFFEHGRSGSCLPEGAGEDLCYHAHLHLAPTDVDLATLVAADFDLELRPDWHSVLDGYRQDPEPYLLVQSGARIGLARTPGTVPRQYLRTKLATALGEPVLADWVAFPSYPLIRSGLRRLHAVLNPVDPR